MPEHDVLPALEPGARLVGADLAGRDLAGVDLSGADLSNADLTGARLVGANLRGASLFQARLEGAHLLDACLDGADLTEVSGRAVILGRASLVGAVLFNAGLQECTMTDADLTTADLRSVDLTGARLRGAVVRGAEIRAATLDGADLTGAVVDGADFGGASLRRAHLGNVSGFSDATWVGVDISDMDLTSAYTLRRFVMDENYLFEFRTSNRLNGVLYRFWKITSDCGRSLTRWAVLTLVMATVFGALYTQVHVDYGDYESPLSPFYFSVVTLTTLGYGDVLPASLTAQIVVLAEVLTGYLMLGGLLSIFATKMGRRAE